MVESPKSVAEQSSQGQNKLSLWRRTPPLVLPMLVLSGGLVVAGAVAVKGIRTATDTVTVTGASTERLRSDYADWTVTVSGNGLSEGVLAELDRALEQHELIKIKLAVGDRDARATVSDELCNRTGADLVQSIGNIALIMRRAAKPDPKLSNLIRVI